MENDSIRASGSDTLVDMWIDGKLRALSVSHEAIGAFLGFERASAISENDRCEFVRTHLPLLVNAAKVRLREDGPAADSITIDVGQLPRPDGRAGDRRRGDRRKGERRKSSRPHGDQPDRRRGDRRTGERRRSAKPSDTVA
jgi:hypothetical protein